MALFLCQVRKATQLYSGRKWSNQYFHVASTVTAALDWAYSVWVDIEKDFHYDDCYAYEVYVNDTEDAPNSIGYTRPVALADAYGSLVSVGAGQKAPTFVTARVDFPVTASRPSRKFYRPVLRESDFDGDNFTGTFPAALNTALNNITAVGGFYDVDGQVWVGTHILKGITSRRMGKLAALAVPAPPS
jgi:hypothetical protein